MQPTCPALDRRLVILTVMGAALGAGSAVARGAKTSATPATAAPNEILRALALRLRRPMQLLTYVGATPAATVA
jgi:hypothetical protein